MQTDDRYRWVAMVVFTLAASLSFLDRQVLAALAPTIKTEFAISNKEYGYLLAAFSFTYALAAPLAGWFIDRVGLNLGISLSVGFWSLVGIATGFVGGFRSLLFCRGALGLTESGGIPASGKAVAIYLRPQERALGSAFGQIGISIGMVGAPVLASALAIRYGWRSAFVVAGLLGFVWIPVWLWVSARIPAQAAEPPKPGEGIRQMATDRRLWGLIFSNMLVMTIYSLWMNWTTVFLVETQGLTQEQANLRLAWIPPLFAALGGLTGGAISLRFASASSNLPAARMKVALIAAIALLATAAAPQLDNELFATAAICWSFFWAVAFSVNLYALPIDYFGPARAASGIAALTFAYGAMQTVFSAVVGELIVKHGFAPVCTVISVFPLAAWAVLRITGRAR
ncbi:MAG: MFS transporter [Acidimicrobiia bacterium]|nr:MFS transporter [Acidimicrobiia bacterium]